MLQLMRFTLNTGESIDYFITRVRKHGIKCEFTAEELHARIIELVIGSRPYDDFRKNSSDSRIPTQSNTSLQTDGSTKQSQKATHNCRSYHLSAEKRTETLTWMPTNQEDQRNEDAHTAYCESCGKKNHWKIVEASIATLQSHRIKFNQKEPKTAIAGKIDQGWMKSRMKVNPTMNRSTHSQ